jgi:luciferase family oxidoreductase group 1
MSTAEEFSMHPQKQLAFSILDLAPVAAGSSARIALRNSLDVVQHAERWGYHRYWVAEHHNIPGIASAATAVVIGHLAGGTSQIRVGAGGIMLPNHAPLIIAEQFGTLEALYPGRIDLGLGRAPGSDQMTARALGRDLHAGDRFPEEVRELQAYFRGEATTTGVKAIPGAGANVPLYLLGSSDFSALLAAEMGLPFAFASHFAPDYLQAALMLYRRSFQPSEVLDRPYVMIGANVFAADSDDEARRLFTSLQQQFINLIRGMPQEVPAPVDTMAGRWSLAERTHVDRMTRISAVGSPATLRKQLEALVESTEADEVIATAQIFDHEARLRSFEIAAEVFQAMASRHAA